MPTFDFKKNILKGVKYLVIFVLPFIATSFIDNFPEIANISIGALLVMIINWLKVKVGLRIP